MIGNGGRDVRRRDDSDEGVLIDDQRAMPTSGAHLVGGELNRCFGGDREDIPRHDIAQAQNFAP